MTDSKGDEQWALPFEVLKVILDWAVVRHKRDHHQRHPATDPYRITPLLVLTKALKSHPLPLLYSDITLYNHRQLLSFLHNVPPSSIDLIQRCTLQVRYKQAPMLGSLKRPVEEEVVRLHEEAEWERESVRAAVDWLIARRAKDAGKKQEGDGRKDQRTLVLRKTSAASLMIAEWLRFPVLELVDYHHPPQIRYGQDITVMQHSLLPSVSHIRLLCDDPAQRGYIYILEAGISNLPHPTRNILVDILVTYQSDQVETMREPTSDLGWLLKASEGVAVKIEFKKGGEKGHLFCEGQMWGKEKENDRIEYVRCPNGACPVQDEPYEGGSERGSSF